ncbi:MAG: DUF2892 domain-containing protein [Salinivirgaceae bacterium]
MKANVGKIDKIIRVILGLAISIVGLLNSSWLGLIGIVPILTAIISWCPLYVPFKINTSKE